MAGFSKLLSDRMIYNPRRLRKKKMKELSVPFAEIDTVTWFKKPFSIFGCVEIKGTIKAIRSDQSKRVAKIVIPDITRGGYKEIESVLESNPSVEFSRVHEKYKF